VHGLSRFRSICILDSRDRQERSGLPSVREQRAWSAVGTGWLLVRIVRFWIPGQDLLCEFDA
jgi:hypothetical protein